MITPPPKIAEDLRLLLEKAERGEVIGLGYVAITQAGNAIYATVTVPGAAVPLLGALTLAHSRLGLDLMHQHHAEEAFLTAPVRGTA